MLIPVLGITKITGVSAVDENGNSIYNMTIEFGADTTFNLAHFYMPAKITDKEGDIPVQFRKRNLLRWTLHIPLHLANLVEIIEKAYP